MGKYGIIQLTKGDEKIILVYERNGEMNIVGLDEDWKIVHTEQGTPNGEIKEYIEITKAKRVAQRGLGEVINRILKQSLPI